MAQELINIGTVPDDGTGENIRLAFDKCNTMYTELYNTVPAPVAEYVRPVDWLPMPVLEQGDEQWSGLYPIYDVDGNFLAVSATTSDVGYTVDWGDGSTPEDIASGVVAEHQYDYADFALQTACSRGYKQAIVTITPQTTETLVIIDPIIIHSNAGNTGDGNAMPWLDIVMAGSSVTACVVGWKNFTFSPLLEKFTFVAHSITDFNNMFNSCYFLQSITLGDMTAGTDFSDMFNSCSSLQSVTLGDMTAGTDFNDMFGYCSSLQSITLGDMTAGTNFSQMFSSCSSLQSVTLGDMTAGTDFNDMFDSCSSLQSITLGDMTAGTNFNNMFNSCYFLQSITLGDMTAGTDFSDMFNSCSSLQSVTLGDMTAGTDFNYMFGYCYSLQSITLGDMTAGTNFSWMFGYCSSLQSVTLGDMTAGTDFNNMFNSCSSLQSITLGDMTAGTNFSQMFGYCYSLQSITLGDMSIAANLTTLGFTACTSLSQATLGLIYSSMELQWTLLSATSLIGIFTALPIVVDSQIINLYGVYGYDDLTPTDLAIATDKGWTITAINNY